jgi:hypothetical protein
MASGWWMWRATKAGMKNSKQIRAADIEIKGAERMGHNVRFFFIDRGGFEMDTNEARAFAYKILAAIEEPETPFPTEPANQKRP